jgi:hypothetical protein
MKLASGVRLKLIRRRERLYIPSSHEDFLVSIIENTRQFPLVTCVAGLKSGTLDLLLAASLAPANEPHVSNKSHDTR